MVGYFVIVVDVVADVVVDDIVADVEKVEDIEWLVAVDPMSVDVGDVVNGVVVVVPDVVDNSVLKSLKLSAWLLFATYLSKGKKHQL